MIRSFQGGKAILFFPKKWANSVYYWITGIKSPKNTIRIRNTANPTEGSSLELDIDVNETYRALLELLKRDFMPRGEFATELGKHVDPNTLTYNQGTLSIDRQAVKDCVRGANDAGEGGSGAAAGVDLDYSEATHRLTLKRTGIEDKVVFEAVGHSTVEGS